MSQQFGGSEYAISSSLGCTLEEAAEFKTAYDKGFAGITKFKEKGSKFVRDHGYILITPVTGHKMYWWDWEQWKEESKQFTQEFWERYRQYHKGTNDDVAQMVRRHFQVQSKYDRMALNTPTQGTGACIIKTAAINLFKWIMQNNLFGKVKLCAMVHDELLVEIPKEIKDIFVPILEQTMLDAAAVFCKSLPIPAEAEVSDHWVH